MRRAVSTLVCALLAGALAAVAASSARADTPVLPDDGSLPWTDPAHASPLEQFLTGLASEVAERQVRVYCNGETDWNSLGSQREFDPNGVGGFVDVRVYWSGEIVEDSNIAHLSPLACWHLWTFGKASLKPTKCQTTETVTETVYRIERYQTTVRVKVKKRVRVKGKWVTKTVWTTKKVWRTRQVPVTLTKQVPGPPAPCYGTQGASPPAEGWDAYDRYALSFLVFAHESIHLFYDRAGYTYLGARGETLANCYGMQLAPWVAWKLGASEDDARAIGRYIWDRIYANYQGTEYWSADCRADGPLDLSPGDGVWP